MSSRLRSYMSPWRTMKHFPKLFILSTISSIQHHYQMEALNTGDHTPFSIGLIFDTFSTRIKRYTYIHTNQNLKHKTPGCSTTWQHTPAADPNFRSRVMSATLPYLLVRTSQTRQNQLFCYKTNPKRRQQQVCPPIPSVAANEPESH